MKKLIGLALLLVVLAHGCIPSVHPLYTMDDVVMDHRLLGVWKSTEEEHPPKFSGLPLRGAKDQWTFETHGEDAYILTLTEKEEKVQEQFIVHLVQLGDHYYFDFFPQNDQEAGVPPIERTILGYMTLFPVHAFAKVEFTDQELRIRFFNDEWLKKLFDQRKVRIKHEKTVDGILLTAPTKDLQQFLIKYAKEQLASDEIIILEKN